LDRNAVWQSTLQHLLSKSPAELTLNYLIVEFKNELGLDAGFNKLVFFHLISIKRRRIDQRMAISFGERSI